MSQLQVNRINDASGGVLAPISSVMRNRIINGAMVIDQRNAGASGTAQEYTVDRWLYLQSQTSKFTWQQNAGSVTPPVGFSNYLGFTSSSAYSVDSSDYFFVRQAIEGFNFADCGWGTANAKTVTLSFQVRSSLTGTFGGSLRNSDANYSYPFSYTISAANTWTTISITIAGPTVGTWVGATNGTGVTVNFGLGLGSTYSGTAGSWSANNYLSATGATSVVGTNGATFYITGVQLEVGTQATSFEYRQYGTELALCQRYYWQQSFSNVLGSGSNQGGCNNFACKNTTNQVNMAVNAPVPMRITPSVTFQANSARIFGNGGQITLGAMAAVFTTGTYSTLIGWTQTATGIGNDVAYGTYIDAGGGWSFSSEL